MASINFSRDEIEGTILQRFAKIARLFPDHIAVATAAQQLTYRELDGEAERVAAFILTQRGYVIEPVALLFENGIPLIAAILGVLKTGKSFVLIDPTDPPARRAAVLADIQAGLAITDRPEISPRGEEQSPCRVVQYAEVRGLVVATPLTSAMSSTDLAVVVYTSGSTGEPKGVMWEHRDLLHRVWLRTSENHARESDRIALLSSNAANTVTNIFLALLNGAALVPFNPKHDNVAGLACWLEARRVSICAISTPLFRKLCETSTGKEKYPDLRIIRLRSDTVRDGDLALFQKSFPAHCVLITGLSTSESGQLTTYQLDPSARLPSGQVPVGYAVPDKEILLLDEGGNEAGTERLGEIVVRSRYLARGYWRRPELTASKFRRDGNDPSVRLCHTGDLGLRLPDGCLLHKGRKDFRVKIRGYGVELAEIERVLEKHAAVRQVLVVSRPNDCGEARSIAYFTSQSECTPSASELRRFVSASLPDYMVPSAFIRLETIPLSRNGKIDRHALPDPGNRRPELENLLIVPRTETERTVTRLFSEVLDITPVGVQDSFFELGGDSLLAARLVSRIHQLLEIELPANQLFESPTPAEIAQLLEEHSDRRRVKDGPLSGGCGETTLAPLSIAQQRLCFVEQLNPGDCAHNLILGFQIRGNLDVTALERSFDALVKRHDALRTIVVVIEGEAYQKVLSESKVEWRVIDLEDLSSGIAGDAEARRFRAAEAQRPFDLMRGPLMRVCLLRLNQNDYQLLVTVHHLVFDGWSMGVLCRELSHFYEGFVSGRKNSMTPLRIQYGDYAQWQRARLEGDGLREQLEYWHSQLEDLAPLKLPTDRPRPRVRTSHGARKFFALSEGLSAKLKKLAVGSNATLFMALLAAFKVLLHRYTGQTDIAVGCPVAGRNHPDTEKLIGFFLNMLVLRNDLSGDPSFRELIQRVRHVCLAAYARQDVSFEKLVQEIGPERDLGRNPLFDVTFCLQNTPRSSLELRNLSVVRLDVDAEIARFDLNLFMEEDEERLRGYFSYNADLFNHDSIDRMADHFTNLLEQLASKPDDFLSSLSILTSAEQQQVLVEWNDSGREYPKDRCIHQCFEAQAEKTPDAPAVICENRQISYRELNRRANQVARYLRGLGVGPEVLVGICLERSLDMVIGLLAVLKAGGAYVPLDPQYPSERLAFILDDADASVLLTEQHVVTYLQRPGMEVVSLQQSWGSIEKENDANLENLATAENLAYVIYTSGSTGMPKGVAIRHASAAAFLSWIAQVFSRSEMAGVLASTSICFDLSVFEIFGTLSCGGRVIVAQNALTLPTLPAADQVTLINTVPSAIVELLRCRALPRSVQTINLAGEPLKTSVVKEIYQVSSVGKVYDLYGPSEDTTYSTYVLRSENGPQTIGKPISNTQTHVLDSFMQPVPLGVTGELHIGGMGLARGYLNRPDLTAERFIPNPFSSEPGARLYKTGDLARYLPDGNIEFIGRADHQIKLRGFRIELGEIEAVLARHPAVREALVVAREDVSEAESSALGSDKQLVAYIVSANASPPAVGELRNFVKNTLPDYMVPSVWVSLDSLPHGLNGKINRAALPAPWGNRQDLEVEFTAPRTEVEQTLARIWAEMLKLEKVGVHDNFFELGGHSLLATQVISRLSSAWNLEISLRSIFEFPTIETLGAVIVEMQASSAAALNLPPVDSTTDRAYEK